MYVTRKSVREVLEDPQDGEYYVLVTRYIPNQVRFARKKINECFDEWDRGLAPSRELLKKYKETQDWDGYVQAFKEEHPIWLLRDHLSTHLTNAEGRVVVLVCEEQADQYPKCHTWLILEMIANVRCL